MSHPCLAPLAVALGVLVLAGCGSSGTTTTTRTATPLRTVDSASIESQIEEQLSVSGAKVTSVTCPDDVKSQAGATFDCSVSWSNGATGKVKVTETSIGHFTYAPVSGSVQVPGTTVATSLEKSLADQGIPNATVTCPQTIVVKLNSTVTCDVTGASGAATGTVSFMFSSAEGTIDSSSVSTG